MPTQAITLAIACCIAFAAETLTAAEKEPIPDKLVVMTFDDSVKSHYTVARPILKQFGFGATFFVTEGFAFKTNKKHYMTWEEIRALHDDGFEIGNHTLTHRVIDEPSVSLLKQELQGIDDDCIKAGIPKPVSFAWPGNLFNDKALPILKEHGIRFARRGGNPEFDQWGGAGPAYEPGKDHHFLIPSAAVPLPFWKIDDMIEALAKAKNGRVTVVQFHGVPEGEHPYVNTRREVFEEFMQYLHDHKYRVIAMRDLEKYVDTSLTPETPLAIIQERMRANPPKM